MSAALTNAPTAERALRAREVARPRPRVLHLITSFDIGGTERQAVELLKRLNHERFDVRLAVLRKEGPFLRELETLFPDVPEFPLTSFYNVNAVRQLARLRRLMISDKIDILHAHDFYSGLIGAAAARLSGVRVIASQRHLRLSDRWVHQLGAGIIHRLAHRVLVNSKAIHDRIIEQGSARANKIVVIRNGVLGARASREHAREGLCRELGLDSETTTLVGFVARIQPVKGHRFFIEAAARISANHTGVHFVLVGDGPLKLEIESQAAQLGIMDRVHLLGDRTDVATLVSAFDLLVLASLHEGLPNAVMEAMAAGVPVVATAVGGTKELIADGETGYLVPPGDPEALAERTLFALRDGQNRETIVAGARRRVTSAFGMHLMVESVERLYDELRVAG